MYDVPLSGPLIRPTSSSIKLASVYTKRHAPIRTLRENPFAFVFATWYYSRS
jgi:hypothetical protein